MKSKDEKLETYRRWVYCECGGIMEYIKSHAVGEKIPCKFHEHYVYEHKCGLCSKEEMLEGIYPKIVYVGEDDD